MPHTKNTLTLSLALASSLMATQSIGGTAGYYVGVFGGGGSSGTTSIQQTATVYTSPTITIPNLQGTAPSSAASMAGAHAGYEWDMISLDTESQWGIRPAVEIEGFYLGNNPSATIQGNDKGTSNLRMFHDTLPMNNGVFVANAVFTIKTPVADRVLPYMGAGVGGATMNISSATGAQQNYPYSEPGLNHFNTNPNASSSALAVNAKIGIKGELVEHFSLFAEYRYVYLGSTGYTFGQTNGASQGYPSHPATSNWNVNMGAQNYFLGVAGIQYQF